MGGIFCRMKTNKLLMATALGASFAFNLTAQGGERPGEVVDRSTLPAAVQKTITEKAGDAKIVQVRREDDADGRWNYEVEVKSNSKEWAFEVDPKGKLTNKHADKAKTE